MALRNQVVFAPAGSGKTERLGRRYIDLLREGVRPERILTLTYTEKAAAEMKQRIFDRLEEHDPELHRELRRDALRMRVSTIHSFCLELVRRFAPTLGLDPRIDVLSDPAEPWKAAKYDSLMAIAEAGRDNEAFSLLLELVTRDTSSGWPKLSKLYDGFFEKRVNIQRGEVEPVDRDLLARARDGLARHPLCAELDDLDSLLPRTFTTSSVGSAIDAIEAQRDKRLTKDNSPYRAHQDEDHRERNRLLADYYGLLRQDRWAAEFARSFVLFKERFLDTYTRRKREAGQVDYDDMESLALKLLETEPDWQNVLRAFDEHTDHLLVDEFQDTSFLQWGIIDKLTEEWRAGEGVKQAKEVEPTVFLVGDEKQSIYMFRDAKVEVFRNAADRLEAWLGKDRLERVPLEDNYRSLQAIIDFNNALFSKLMNPADDAPAWRTRYAPFRRARDNDDPGRVEIILDPCEGNADERRERDAANVCRRILALLDPSDPLTVFDREPDGTETARACRPADIAILIRSRTVLPAIEEGLRKHHIPFLVGGGTGFYGEPEVRYCIALLAALADPADGLALYATLRGPVFDIPERDLLLGNVSQGPMLIDRLRAAPADSETGRAIAQLEEWRAALAELPLARILERAFAERGTWEKFWEPQRHANLRKLIRFVEDRQASGESPLRVLRALRDAGGNESKADVRPEGLDAVQVMTIHGAKGLQFPVVFIPGLDEDIKPLHDVSGTELVIEETSADEVTVSWIPDPGLRRRNELHMEFREKEIEEEKRVFYVACTRPRDALFLTGTLHKNAEKKSRLGWLSDSIGLRPAEYGFAQGDGPAGTTIVAASDIPVLPPLTPKKRARPRRVQLRKVTTPPPPRVRQMSRHLPRELLRPHPELLHVGEVIHETLQAVSESRVTPGTPELEAEVRRLIARHGVEYAEALETVLGQVKALRENEETWDIIRPRDNAEAELPLMYSDGETVWSGRADRVVFEQDGVSIYDYKTFPVENEELDELVREYHDEQLFHYAATFKRMHPGKNVRTFLVFTARPLVVETGV